MHQLDLKRQIHVLQEQEAATSDAQHEMDPLRTELDVMTRRLESCEDHADLSDMAGKSTSQELVDIRTEAFAAKESLLEARRTVVGCIPSTSGRDGKAVWGFARTAGRGA